MDKDVIRKQLTEELQARFDTKLREIKRQKAQAEEELEAATEAWRTERRKLNAEIDRLETALADVREPARRKAPASQAPPVVDPQEIARIQNAAGERLKKSEAEWELERTRLVSQVSRLERAVAEAIERSSNPLRSTQPIKEQFEAKLDEAAKDRLRLEQELLRAKAAWDEDKKKLTGELIKLRRFAPASKALEVKEKLERLQGRKETVEEARIRELEEKLTQSHAEIQKYHQAAGSAREETRSLYEPRLEEAYRERVKVEEHLATAAQRWDTERQHLHSQVAQLQQALAQAQSQSESPGSESRAKPETELLQKPGFRFEKAAQPTVLAEEEWSKERERMQAEIQQLQRTLSETPEQVSSEIVDQLRLQYDQKIQDIIQQKNLMSQDLQAASALLRAERSRFAGEVSQGSGSAVDTGAINAEVARIESKIQEIARLIDDPSTDLSTVIRKNVEKAEMDAYVKGILFSVGRGTAI